MIQCDLLDTEVDPGIRRYRARFCIECRDLRKHRSEMGPWLAVLCRQTKSSTQACHHTHALAGNIAE